MKIEATDLKNTREGVHRRIWKEERKGREKWGMERSRQVQKTGCQRRRGSLLPSIATL